MYLSCRHKVFYKSNSGVMVFENKKVVFQHRNSQNAVKVGLGVLEHGSYVDKGKYAFADMQNVDCVIPAVYFSVDFFENKGVPLKVSKGSLGDSIFLKEDYVGKSFIKAYDHNGAVLLYESEFVHNKDYVGKNMYYSRLFQTVGTWECITEQVHKGVFETLKVKNCTLEIDNPVLTSIIKGLKAKIVRQAANGLVFVDGNYETLVFWNCEKGLIKMAWLGRSIDDDVINKEIGIRSFVRHTGVVV